MRSVCSGCLSNAWNASKFFPQNSPKNNPQTDVSKLWQNVIDHAGEIFEENAKNLPWLTSTVEFCNAGCKRVTLPEPELTLMATPTRNPKHEQRGRGSTGWSRGRGLRVQGVGFALALPSALALAQPGHPFAASMAEFDC